ncbi:T9SS type A sorting domain-containing protein [Prolixibacteraceae bacterium JC049]|nr:T9SS type A sorting domain-containing protein [Prolixibacteraceae bacterium JC049]
MKILFTLFILAVSFSAFAQNEASYLLFLKDKTGTSYSTDSPEEFLSAKAIERRNKSNIEITNQDLPLSKIYTDSILNLGPEIIAKSKWLNTVTIRTADKQLIDTITKIAFIDSVLLTKPGATSKSARSKFNINAPQKVAAYDSAFYGSSWQQIKLHRGQLLNHHGFKGKGIEIAVLDAGFYRVNELAAFDSIRMNNQILGTRDFVYPKQDVYTQHQHGMQVLSTIAANLPNKLVAPATKAKFWLLRSEDDNSEYQIEEDFWIAAAEFADSVGVDIITSSLGYTEFDDSTMNYTPAQMNGKTARITNGANIAAQKGILVVNSAGNEGGKAWKVIGAPADGEHVMAVGGVYPSGVRVYFSSVNSNHGFVKPNVMSVGAQTQGISPSGEVTDMYGTSFSCPLLTALAACLWQALPEKNNFEIKALIEQISDRYETPDKEYGYGIPDFFKPLSTKYSSTAKNATSQLSVSNNPFHNTLTISGTQSIKTIAFFNLNGQRLFQLSPNGNDKVQINTSLFKNYKGVVVVQAKTANSIETLKLIRK